MEDLSHAVWRTSSHSGGNNGDCVEIGRAPAVVGIRDTKNRDGDPRRRTRGFRGLRRRDQGRSAALTRPDSDRALSRSRTGQGFGIVRFLRVAALRPHSSKRRRASSICRM
ncbi:DUF397 domain-containing protein [Actinoalloteichus hymeniacidonis]|uniref:DUF397 family protein n=1 Tax=Actinoalloteichus hymeniacidonis TaxID=340345 RepID=A0AAC9HRV0_9PSEU|nr:DUF397 domain-containing protein [Actinoalloteichus hymeniacidonis]AOS63350.1 putative DUF397 family protein [Actinoalloteichus hymeniacidonis]MBB5908610.1 hypothetical protein [Actinoalloteichus hymeniacidonis]